MINDQLINLSDIWRLSVFIYFFSQPGVDSKFCAMTITWHNLLVALRKYLINKEGTYQSFPLREVEK